MNYYSRLHIGNRGGRILPQIMLQMCSRRLLPHTFIVRRFEWDPLLQAPLRSALQGEGKLLSSHEDYFPQEYCIAGGTGTAASARGAYAGGRSGVTLVHT